MEAWLKICEVLEPPAQQNGPLISVLLLPWGICFLLVPVQFLPVCSLRSQDFPLVLLAVCPSPRAHHCQPSESSPQANLLVSSSDPLYIFVYFIRYWAFGAQCPEM